MNTHININKHETNRMNRINMNATDASKPGNRPTNKKQLGTKDGEELGYCLRPPIPTGSQPRHRPAIKASAMGHPLDLRHDPSVIAHVSPSPPPTIPPSLPRKPNPKGPRIGIWNF